jgi:hypothetical protein
MGGLKTGAHCLPRLFPAEFPLCAKGWIYPANPSQRFTRSVRVVDALLLSTHLRAVHQPRNSRPMNLDRKKAAWAAQRRLRRASISRLWSIFYN